MKRRVRNIVGSFLLISSQKNAKRELEKRANPAAAQMTAKAGEKAVDMAGKMAEKQMETMEQQKSKAEKFLGEEVCSFPCAGLWARDQNPSRPFQSMCLPLDITVRIPHAQPLFHCVTK